MASHSLSGLSFPKLVSPKTKTQFNLGEKSRLPLALGLVGNPRGKLLSVRAMGSSASKQNPPNVQEKFMSTLQMCKFLVFQFCIDEKTALREQLNYSEPIFVEDQLIKALSVVV